MPCTSRSGPASWHAPIGALVSLARGSNRSWEAEQGSTTEPAEAFAAEAFIEDVEAGASI